MSLEICDIVKSAHQQKVRQIWAEIESLRDILKGKSGDEGITEFDQTVFEKTETKKNSILNKQNKKLKSLQNKLKTPSTHTQKNNALETGPKQKQKQKKTKTETKTVEASEHFN